MQDALTTLGTSKDDASVVNIVLSQLALSQTSSSSQKAPTIEEADVSSDESEFSSLEITLHLNLLTLLALLVQLLCQS